MSQHTFATTYQGRPVTLLMGWDRPLQGFFMVVTRDDAAEDEPETVYCNLDDEGLAAFRGLCPFLDYFKDKLRELGMEAPATMLSEVERDGWMNTGNRNVTHRKDDDAPTGGRQ